jgi:hypothetical protein
MVSKFDALVVVAFVAGTMLWIEQEHRTRIGLPVETDTTSAAHAAGCPDNDTLPYTTSCIAFLEGDRRSHTPSQPKPAAASAPRWMTWPN